MDGLIDRSIESIVQSFGRRNGEREGGSRKAGGQAGRQAGTYTNTKRIDGVIIKKGWGVANHTKPNSIHSCGRTQQRSKTKMVRRHGGYMFFGVQTGVGLISPPPPRAILRDSPPPPQPVQVGIKQKRKAMPGINILVRTRTC